MPASAEERCQILHETLCSLAIGDAIIPKTTWERVVILGLGVASLPSIKNYTRTMERLGYIKAVPGGYKVKAAA